MISERPWLFASTLAGDFRKIYSTYLDSFRNKIKTWFLKWKEQIDPNMEEQLNKHIYTEKVTTYHPTFTVDLNRYLYISSTY